jgi:hypothetical protein
MRRFLPPRLRYDPAALDVAVPPKTEIRLFIGPVNFAGQAWQWARSAERNIDSVGAVVMAYRLGTEFGFPVDDSVPVAGYLYSKTWQTRQRDSVRDKFTHVIVEAERHLFGRVFDQKLDDQIDELVSNGVRVAMLCHGSDIRLPSRHAAENPYSPFHKDVWDQTPFLERQARENRALLDRLRLPVFVSTPDLLDDVPYASWLPVVVEPERWRTASEPLFRNVPVVAHAPSEGMVKGSELIDPVMRMLHDEGVVQYLRVTNVPAAEMPRIYGDADIVLDQFRLGGYGVAACEALAAGRVVVGHVSEAVREHIQQATGRDVPIVEATADSLEEVIRRIVAGPDRYRTVAREGMQFVDSVHDGRFAADVMRPFLLGRH